MNRIITLLALKPILYGLIGMVLSGLTFPLTGVIVVRNNLISMRYMLMHGVVLGGILSAALDTPLLATVIPINIILVILINYMNEKGYSLSNASSAMMVFTIGLASVLSHLFNVPAKDTLEVLWGSPFALTRTDLIITFLLGVSIVVYISTCFRQICAIFFDRDIASSSGVNVKVHSNLMMLFTSLVISVAMKELGALLIDALLILPVISVAKDTQSLKQVFIKSSLTGLFLSVSGYFTSLLFNIPVSGIIAVLSAILLCVKNLKIRKFLIALFALFLVSQSLHAAPVKELQLPEKDSYVASTGWVASICQIAGLDDMTIIAPSDMKHPPEYEIKPDDIYVIAHAKYFMHAGYEVMMETIREASEIDSEKVIKVKTTNTLKNITDMVNRISQITGEHETAQIRLEKFTQMFEEARNRIKKSEIRNIGIYVNVNQAELAEDLGLKISGTFGPGPLTSDQIAEIAENKYSLIIDNYHNPVASPALQVNKDIHIVEWKNFPDTISEDALLNLIKENVSMLF